MVTTYQIQIDSSVPLGKSILALLKSAGDAVTLKAVRTKSVAKAEEHSPLYYRLQSGFRDVREILDGKQKRQTLDEFLDELRNSND
jgi:hypothetical protein